MPDLGQQAPYDSLALVTELTRVALQDFIQGLQPNLAGIVTTTGQNVVLISGQPFTFLMTGLQIFINGAPFTVQAVTGANSLTLTGSAGNQANVKYSAILQTGDIFSNSQAYVLPTINLAWRKLQKKLATTSHPRLKNRTVLFGIPVVTNLDPAIQQFISWDSFFDGTSLQIAPVLPLDFISPLRLNERLSGFQGGFRLMTPAADGLRSCVKTSWNRNYEWRNDAIYIPGALLPTDIELEYSALLPDLVVGTGSTFQSVPVPIMRCADALAYYTAGIFVAPRGGDALVPGYEMKGDEATDQITNSAAKFQQRQSFHRRAWGERGRRGSNRFGI